MSTLNPDFVDFLISVSSKQEDQTIFKMQRREKLRSNSLLKENSWERADKDHVDKRLWHERCYHLAWKIVNEVIANLNKLVVKTIKIKELKFKINTRTKWCWFNYFQFILVKKVNHYLLKNYPNFWKASSEQCVIDSSAWVDSPWVGKSTYPWSIISRSYYSR